MSGKFDQNLCDILSNVREIDTFLDVIFEFLHRRTDFYKIMRHEHDSMGLPPGLALKLVEKHYLKYVNNGHRISKQGDDHTDVTVASEVTVTTEEPPKENTTARKADKETAPAASPEDAHDRRIQDMIMPCDTYNGALRETYCWSQTIADLDIKLFVPETLKKGKDLDVSISDNHIKITTKDSLVLMDSKLTQKIRSNQSMWSLHPSCYIQMSLDKLHEGWWLAIVEGEPTIDKQKINNEVQISDMDEESHQELERVVYDQAQKTLGKPTSKQQKTEAILRESWDAEGSPFKGQPFDSTILNIAD